MKGCDIEVNLTLSAVYHFIDSNNLEKEGPAKKGASKKKKKKKKEDWRTSAHLHCGFKKNSCKPCLFFNAFLW